MIRQKEKAWTVRGLMKFGIDYLRRSGIGEARLTVELLLSHVLKCARIDLYAHGDRELSDSHLAAFKELLQRKLSREPLQYIIGTAVFMGLPFRVDQRVLVPRPETESLVEQIMLSCGEIGGNEDVKVIDIGTGSGNIAISVAKFVPRTIVVGVDISEEALEVARLNARVHDVTERVQFLQADIVSPLPQDFPRNFDVLASNPPYCLRDDWETLQPEVKRYEPKIALDGGPDGLSYYRRLLRLVPGLVREGGTILFETGGDQAAAVSEMMHECGLVHIQVTEDLQGVPRVVRGKLRPKKIHPSRLN